MLTEGKSQNSELTILCGGACGNRSIHSISHNKLVTGSANEINTYHHISYVTCYNVFSMGEGNSLNVGGVALKIYFNLTGYISGTEKHSQRLRV